MQGPGGFDPRWLTGCLQGHDGAWRSLVAAHIGLVTAIVRRVLARRGLPFDRGFVEEEVAGFFAELCLNRERALGDYRGDGPFDAYLAVMAANHIRRRAEALEQESRNLEEFAAHVSLSHSEGDGSPLEGHEIAGVLGACTAEEKLLYRLFYVDGASAEEVSALLGISRPAAYLRKHRFHAKVKRLLNERSSERKGSPDEKGDG